MRYPVGDSVPYLNRRVVPPAPQHVLDNAPQVVEEIRWRYFCETLGYWGYYETADIEESLGLGGEIIELLLREQLQDLALLLMSRGQLLRELRFQ